MGVGDTRTAQHAIAEAVLKRDSIPGRGERRRRWWWRRKRKNKKRRRRKKKKERRWKNVGEMTTVQQGTWERLH